MENDALLDLLSDTAALVEKVNEALLVLQESGTQLYSTMNTSLVGSGAVPLGEVTPDVSTITPEVCAAGVTSSSS